MTGLDTAEIARMSGVTAVHREQDVSVLLVTHAEPVVRELLARDASLTHLEITSVGLEDAFVALTQTTPSGDVAVGGTPS